MKPQSGRRSADCSKHEPQQHRMLDRRWYKVVYAARSACVLSTIVDVVGSRYRQPSGGLNRYSGAVLLRQRKTSTAILKLMRSGALSQCSSWSNGVTRSYLRLLYINLAAALSTDWSRSSMYTGIHAMVRP